MDIHAPFAGIVHVKVAPGELVCTGDIVATVEAVKLEAAVPSTAAGRVVDLRVEDYADVEGGDTLLTLKEVDAV